MSCVITRVGLGIVYLLTVLASSRGLAVVNGVVSVGTGDKACAFNPVVRTCVLKERHGVVRAIDGQQVHK